MEKLKELRKILHKTQEEVATSLNLNRQTYARYETGVNEPDMKTLIKLADYFHTTVDFLLEHHVPYLLDKSTLTDSQNELIDKIQKLNNLECEKLNAYAEGLIQGRKEIEQNISAWKK